MEDESLDWKMEDEDIEDTDESIDIPEEIDSLI